MINLIIPCTNSKKISSNELLSISNLPSHLYINEGITTWQKNLQIQTFSSYPAKELYKGISWQYSLKTYESLKNKIASRLLIASAGFGLIDADQKIPSYNSTFTPHTLNSITKFQNSTSIPHNVLWWDSINQINAIDFPSDSSFFIILPFDYLIATQNFINDLINRFSNKVFIFSVNKNPVPVFMVPYLIKFDARFDSFHKGVKSSLLQRATYWLTNEIINQNLDLKHSILQNHIEQHLRNYEEFKMPVGMKMNIDQLKNQIILMINENNISSASEGLRLLRKNGISCEQKKFGQLYKEVKSEIQ